MTEHTSDHENPSKNPSRPEGQDTSETMDNKNPQDPGTTEVLPAAETPPTQEIAQATQRLPEGPAPEGEVHPAYGVAAARVQEQEAAATVIQDAPARDDSDPLATLRDPAPEAPATPGATAPASAPAQPTQAQPVHQGRAAQARPTQATTKRGPRVGTAVWGLIVIAVGLGILAVSAGVMFDVGVALILLLGAAGVILVVGSVISSIRRR
jgi:hypothetical protein